jgi:hypothetical protein
MTHVRKQTEHDMLGKTNRVVNYVVKASEKEERSCIV